MYPLSDICVQVEPTLIGDEGSTTCEQNKYRQCGIFQKIRKFSPQYDRKTLSKKWLNKVHNHDCNTYTLDFTRSQCIWFNVKIAVVWIRMSCEEDNASLNIFSVFGGLISKK
jgi:hypothetical protein